MSVLVVGSVALDSVETPFGKADDVLGGSGTYFSASASHLTDVQLVGVVGNDYPIAKLRELEKRNVDLSGIEQADGASFRWRGRYRYDLNSAETLETHLGVFSHFEPKIPPRFAQPDFLFLANIDPRLQLAVLKQVKRPKLVASDTMNFWIESRRPELLEILSHVDLITLNDGEARQLTEQTNLVQAAKWILARGPKYVIIKKGEHGAFLFDADRIFFAPAYPLETVVRSDRRGRLFRRWLHRLSRAYRRPLHRQHAPRCGLRICHGVVRRREVFHRAIDDGHARRNRCARPRVPPARCFRRGSERVTGDARASGGAPLDYRAAGVDVGAGDEAKRRIRSLVESTYTAGVRGAFGAFGGMFRMPSDVRDPLLVASADGVGTKIKVAIEADRHDTIGHDLVNHCTNDILVQGAIPLFFLDYVAFGKLDPRVLELVVSGVSAGCRENGCALLGGETAEMPDVYAARDYDLAGFIVGCVGESDVLGPARVKSGDVLVALPSAGLHTNGYSLARKIVSERLRIGPGDEFPAACASVADVLLAGHTSYLAALRPVLPSIHAMAHITGGGIPGNLDRALPSDLDAVVELGSWSVPSVFRQLQSAGSVPSDDMFRTFNMGVGMVVLCDQDVADSVMQSAARAGLAAWLLGHVRAGSGRVILS